MQQSGLRSRQLAACCAGKSLGMAGTVHLVTAWDLWHLLGPTPGGHDPASWVDPDKCPPLSGPPVGKAREVESLRRGRRGLESEPEVGTSPLTGDFGFITQPLGSLSWPTVTAVQRISKKTWSAYKNPCNLSIKLIVNVHRAVYCGMGTTFYLYCRLIRFVLTTFLEKGLFLILR